MGTESKVNCYSKKTSTGCDSIPKVVKSSSSSSDLAAQVNNCNGTAVVVANGKETTSPLQLRKTATSNGPHSATAAPVPFVPIHIDEHHVVEGAKEILKVIRPHWDLNAVQFKKFTDGITNKLVGCFFTPAENTNSDKNIISVENCSSNNNTTSSSSNGNSNDRSASPANDTEEEDEEDSHNDSGNLSDSTDTDTAAEATEVPPPQSKHGAAADNVVLVRVYGNKTDLLIDRKAETRNFVLLHSYGFAPSLYATFKNGLAYDYVPGVTLNTANVLQPAVWQLVACRMANMHRVVNADAARGIIDGVQSASPPISMLWKKTQSFFDLVPERFSNPAKHQRLAATFLPISRMREEFAALYKRLESLGSPMVFAHNDILLGNVVYTESLQRVNFIDYEYADYNFQAFDIGNHFAEFAGVDDADYARYPSRDFQLEWLRVYLQTYLQRPQITAAEVQRLYVQVNQFALGAHFFWTIWCLIQAEHSTIDFDYVAYAFTRYNEYLAKKDEFLALEMETDATS